MGARFLTALLTAFVLTLAVLGGLGYAVTQTAVPPPRDVFRAAFFEFDLAPGWWCLLEGSEYVCHPPGKPPYDAIAVMAMKERNDQDNLDAYEAHLRQSQRRNATDTQLSEIRFVKRRKIGTQEWVEALHSGSELANYNTYYLGTTTSFVGILVTMSVHEQHAEKYIRQMNDMMATLVIYQR